MATVSLYAFAVHFLSLLTEKMKELNSLPVAIADELDSLLILVEAIVAKLLHAEEQQINRPDIIIWIQSLSNAMYEADDLLGEIFTEVVRRPREDGWKNLITCFMASSLSNSVSKMARDLNVMRQKLEDIFNEHRLEFKVRTADFDEAPIGKGNGFGFIPIVGREDDFDSLESHLLGYQAGRKNQSESVVISICGMAGLGKTTLAQRLYHHESIKQHFVLRVWVNASNNFNIKRIVGEMWESTTREKHNDMLGLGQLTRMLLENMEVIRSRVVEARCLLVLDDVWNQDPDEWSSLLNLFKHFDTGSKLLVTTRSQSVVDVTGGVPYHLHGLSTEASERLLVHVVTGGEVTEVGLLRTIDVGKTISICNRNPLAIRMFGRQLANSNDPRIGHFHVGMAEEEDIIKSAVRLTYEELPSRLKLCFGHCSLFPKDSEIQVQTLIHLWIAQGFVRPPKKAEQGTIEDVGYNYFVELMRRSLLQGVKDDLDNVKTFKVCNLMHELASSIAGSTTGTVRSGRGNISECIIIPRHISLSTYFDASMELPTVTSAESLCTIFLANQNLQQSWRIRHSGAILEKASSYACLRALDFHKSGIEKVPASIRNLKVLRYLDLSENDIELLPNTITQMFNLQVLNLSGCELLKRLPSRIEKLVNLRHLYCDKCWNLSHMPLGIGELTCLITLTCFVLPENAYVASRYKAAGLEQLRHLNALRGRFEIRNLGGYIKNVGGTKLDKSSTSFLRDKKGLRSLSLCWGHLKSDHLGQQYDLSLKFLEPPLEIKELMLSEYVGEEFPSWVSSLKNLISLQIRDCHRCRYLPPLEEFPLLKFLKVKNLPELEYISSQGKEKYGGLSSLKKLYIFQCRKLRGWWKEEGMQMQDSCMQQQPQFHDDLMRLEIYNCPKLDKMPLFPSLEEKLCLHNTSLGPLRETMKIQVITGPSSSPTPISRPLSKLKSLRISSIHEAEVPPEDWLQELTSLRELRIKCWALAYLPSEIRRLTSLRELDISYCPRLMQRFAGNKSKDWHHISHIPNIKIDKQMVQLGEIYLLNEVDSAALMEKISVQFVQDVIYFASADVGTSNVSLKAPVLMKWVNKVEQRSCEIKFSGKNKGFSLFSSADVSDDGVLLVVPLDLAITPMRVLQDPLIGPDCRAMLEEGEVDDRFLMILFLLVERLRENSCWKPYLDWLPTTFGNPLWFSDDDLLELKGTALYRASELQKKSLMSLYEDKTKDLVRKLLVLDGNTKTEATFEDFLWANSVFWSRALNIPFPRSYVFPTFQEDNGTYPSNDDVTCEAADPANDRGAEKSKLPVCEGLADGLSSSSSQDETIWVEGLVPGIDFCNHDLRAMATWEVDGTGSKTGTPCSMYLLSAEQSLFDIGKEISISYGSKGNEELLYLYGFVMENNPDDYLMVHYPIEALQSAPFSEAKLQLLHAQKAEMRYLLPKSLLNKGFFPVGDTRNGKHDKAEATKASNFSWSGQRRTPCYIDKLVFLDDFLTALRTVAMREDELFKVSSLLEELVGSDAEREPTASEVRAAIWEVCGDSGAFQLLVDILQTKMTDLEEGTGTEEKDCELLQLGNAKNAGNHWSSIVY